MLSEKRRSLVICTLQAILDMLRQNARLVEIRLDNTYVDAYMMKRINERLIANRIANSVADDIMAAPPPSLPFLIAGIYFVASITFVRFGKLFSFSFAAFCQLLKRAHITLRMRMEFLLLLLLL